MGVDDKNVEIAMEPVVTPDAPNTGEVSDAEHASILRQTRTRRLFSASQLFAFMLVYFTTWQLVAGNIFFALQNGGPRAWFFSYIIVCFGTVCQVVCMAEMASLQPIAGAQYYWTWSLSSPKHRKFLTWIQGWITWTAYVTLLAAAANGSVINIHGVISLAWKGDEPYTATGWHTTLIFIAWVVFATVINLYAFWLVPWIEYIGGILNFLLFIATLVILWVMAPRNNLAELFMQKSEGSGWDDFTSFNVGSLSSVFLFVGFESLVHLGEETRNPKRAVPNAMFWGIIANIAMGFLMIFTFGVALPPVEDVLSSASPMAAILSHATGNNSVAMGVQIGVVILYNAVLFGAVASISRLTWAWARDGGLPKYFAIVDAKTRVPERAVWGTSFFVCLLSLLNLNNQAFIAFGAITSLTTLATFCSYTMVMGCLLYARFTNPEFARGTPGEWTAGKFWGMFCNVFGLIFTIYEMIWLPFPALLPVTAANMNYSGPVFGFVVIFVVSYWFLWGKRHWAGPNLQVVEYVLKADEAEARKRKK